MNISIAQKQNYLYFTLILLTILTAIISYRLFEKKWLILKEAERQFYAHDFQQAIPLYQKSLGKGPTTPKAFLHLADSYVATGNFSEGIKYYRLYLEELPQDDAVRLLLARALSWNGNFKEAEKEYQKILEENKRIEKNSSR